MDIINLNNICGGCAAVNLGTKLDTLEKDLAAGKTYSGELLSEEEVETLNNICPVLSQLSLGTYINNMLKASKEGNEIENLTEEQINILNNQTCGGFQSAQVGTKVSEFVEIINEGGKSDEANILTFVVNDVEGAIDQENGTVTVDVPHGTVLTAIAPTFTLSTGAVAKVGNVVQESGVTTNDFTNSVTYVITAEDGETTKSYTVSIIPDNTIPWEEDTVSHIMVFDKNVTTSVNADTLDDPKSDSGAILKQDSGEPQDCGWFQYDFKDEGDNYTVHFHILNNNSDNYDIIDATYTSEDGLHWVLSGEYAPDITHPTYEPLVPFTEDRTEIDVIGKYYMEPNESYPQNFFFICEFIRTTEAGIQ